MSVHLQEGKYHIDGMFSVVINKTNVGIAAHTHDFIELVYVLRGRCLHTVDGTHYPMGHGDMLLINYHSQHSYTCDGEIEYVNILIKPEMVSRNLNDCENAFALLELEDFEEFRNTVNSSNCLVHFEGKERKKIETLIFTLADEYNAPRSGGDLALRSALNLLLISVFRGMALVMRSCIYGIDRELLDYVKTNCCRTLSLEELADYCGYNPCYFSRLFKKHTGVTLSEYLTVCRIERASQLLIETDLSVEQIIGEVGFSNRTKFFKEFTRRIGITPLGFRKEKSCKKP